MSVLKNLKSIFVTEVPKAGPEAGKAAPEADPSTVSDFPTASDPPAPPVEPVSGHADEKILHTLLEAIEANNLGGFDYIEFKRAVKGLEKMVGEEALRFKSAFATASTMGVTSEKLMETANFYLGILEKEREKFTHAAAEQTQALVENRKAEIRQMMAAMERKREEISKLQHELTESESRLELLQRGIESASRKIDETKRNFDVSFNQLKEQISADIRKMKDFLK